VTRLRALALRAFPGDRRVWLVAAGVAVVFGALIGDALLERQERYTGTNSVRSRNASEAVQPGQRVCANGLDVPAGTGRIQLDPIASQPATLEATVQPAGEPPIDAGRFEILGQRKLDIPIPERAAQPASTPASVCLEVEGFEVRLGGTVGVGWGHVPPTIDGRSIPFRPSAWFLPPAGEKRSLASHLPDALRRAALFRPDPIGPWTYWVLFLLVLPGLAYAALRLLATAGARGRPPAWLAVALIALGQAWTWALLTPPFQSPDEPDHFAYVQYLAETGKAPSGEGPVQSSAAVLALDGVRTFSSIETPDSRPPWLASQEREWERRAALVPNRDDDGGAPGVSTGPHSPLYYGLLAPAYLAAGDSTFSELTAARLLSAFFLAVIAACAFGIVREIVPRRPALAVGAGLLVAFQPMLGFISGALNNDSGVNAAAALALYLTVRAMRRGLSARLGAALGAALVVMPLMKFSGFALVPVVLLGLAVVAVRELRSTRRLGPVPWLALAGTAALLFAVWSVASGAFDRTTFTTPGGATPVADTIALERIGGYISYIWQVFLPELPGMNTHWGLRWPAFNIYVEGGFAAFGWQAVHFPPWVNRTIAAVLLLLLGAGIAALVRRRADIRGIAPELVVIALAPITLISAVHVSYYSEVPGPIGEQGRYAFPVVTALAAAALAWVGAFRRSLTGPLVTLLVAAAIGLAAASQLLALTGFYA